MGKIRERFLVDWFDYSLTNKPLNLNSYPILLTAIITREVSFCKYLLSRVWDFSK